MAAAAFPTFERAVRDFIEDRSAASPIPDEANPGLVLERNALCNAVDVLQASSGVPDPAVGPGGVGVDSATQYRDALAAFIEQLNVASTFIQRQGAATSHVWANNLFGAVVHREALSTHSAEVRAALTEFDAVARAWEALVQSICSVSSVSNKVRYKVPMCARGPVCVDTVTGMYYQSTFRRLHDLL